MHAGLLAHIQLQQMKAETLDHANEVLQYAVRYFAVTMTDQRVRSQFEIGQQFKTVGIHQLRRYRGHAFKRLIHIRQIGQQACLDQRHATTIRFA